MKSKFSKIAKFFKKNKLAIILISLAVLMSVLSVCGVLFIIERMTGNTENFVCDTASEGEKIIFNYGSPDNPISVDVLSDVDTNTLNNDNFTDIDGLKYYIENGEKKSTIGIDVSEFQGYIDWQSVSEAGVEFAMIRSGFRGYTQGGLFEDSNVYDNLVGATENGIEVGLYFFSQATTEQEAREEALYVLDIAKEYNITYPIAFDWERNDEDDSRTKDITPAEVTLFADAFCSEIEKNGYESMIYYNEYYGYMLYDLSKLSEYGMWYVEYDELPDFYYAFDMWQYTESGSIPGIDGTVDINLYFKK
ncbi:MAG: glycoside hydrolase family 25 protein [Clostridia bacterium]|nr:glycoside hydrolase family 25 protein [Clostridia bacterium]